MTESKSNVIPDEHGPIPDVQDEKPKQIDKEKPAFTVPLRELEVGKAGVSDLFDKINEVVRFINALDIQPFKA